FFSSRRRHTRFSRDWSSDVCSSDLLKAFFKKHLGHSAIYTSPCREITISAAENIPVHIDGELMGSLPAKIHIHPAALYVLTPPRSEERREGQVCSCTLSPSVCYKHA